MKDEMMPPFLFGVFSYIGTSPKLVPYQEGCCRVCNVVVVVYLLSVRLGVLKSDLNILYYQFLLHPAFSCQAILPIIVCKTLPIEDGTFAVDIHKIKTDANLFPTSIVIYIIWRHRKQIESTITGFSINIFVLNEYLYFFYL